MSHHSSKDDPKIQSFTKEHFQQFISTGQKIQDDINNILKLGPTHTFPEGRFTEHDEGGIKFAVYGKDGKVVINFGSPVSWLATNPEQAIELGRTLIKHAREILRDETA